MSDSRSGVGKGLKHATVGSGGVDLDQVGGGPDLGIDVMGGLCMGFPMQ